MRGGTITVGQLHGNTPGSAFPLIDIATCNTATLNFVENRYIPLYAGPNGAEPKIDESLSAAEPAAILRRGSDSHDQAEARA